LGLAKKVPLIGREFIGLNRLFNSDSVRQ
jgi:hypothetical protein